MSTIPATVTGIPTETRGNYGIAIIMLVIAVRGTSGWVCNVIDDPHVRLKHKGRWRDARAEILPWEPDSARRLLGAFVDREERAVGEHKDCDERSDIGPNAQRHG